MEYKDITTDIERAFYGAKDCMFTNCTFSGSLDGESALKECDNLKVKDCNFELRYPLWHLKNSNVIGSKFADNCRAPMWYMTNVCLKYVTCNGIKAIRECDGITVENSNFNSDEFAWFVKNSNFYKVNLTSTYPFFKYINGYVTKINLNGKYSFQYAENIFIRKSKLVTKDAFWHSKNVTVLDCQIEGEYLGWYSENLTFINCTIKGTQALCYAKNLKLINCKVESDLAFENSTVDADIVGRIESVKNPIGNITTDKVGKIIIDEFSRGESKIIERNSK